MDLQYLREQLADARTADLSKLRGAVALIEHRGKLEDDAQALALDLDVDEELVLRVIGPAWSSCLVEPSADALTGEQLQARVRAATISVVTALAEGKTSLPDPVLQRALEQVIDDGMSGLPVISLREVFSTIACAHQGRLG